MEGKKNFESVNNSPKASNSQSAIEKCSTNRAEAQEFLQKASYRLRRKSSKTQIKSKVASQSNASFELKPYKRKPKTIWCDLCPKKKSFTSKVL